MKINNIYKANYQDLLKTLAVIAMLIDHLGLFVFPQYKIMRIIGRISMPIFCFYAGYNFHGNARHSLGIWAMALTLINLLLSPPYINPNILIPIYLGSLYLLFIHKTAEVTSTYLHIILLLGLCFIVIPFMDYGTIPIIIMIIANIARSNSEFLKRAICLALGLSLLHTIIVFNLSIMDMLASCILSGVMYKLMLWRDFNITINCNLRFIGRNTIYIYVFDLILMQIIYRYYYLGIVYS